MAACAAILFAAPHRARAYCRTTTRFELVLTCDQPCITEGIPLDWAQPCIGFSVNEEGSTGIAVDRVGAVAEAAFARWTTDVVCPEGPIGVSVIRDPAPVLCDRDHYASRGGNVNVIAFVSDWTEREYDESAFALTQVKFHPPTGQIFDADVLFNEESWTFTECPAAGCTDGRVDFENTMVHEAGHFLGLAHSPDDVTAVMWACAAPGDTDKRQLRADDIAGVCAIFGGRDYAGAACDPTPRGGLDGSCPDAPPGTCGCSVAGSPRWPSTALVLVVLVLALRRRRIVTLGEPR